MIEDTGQVCCFGQLGDRAPLSARLTITHPSVYRDIVLGGSIGAAEAFIRGHWHSPDLVSLVRLMAKNLRFFNQLDNSGWGARRLSDKLYHWFNRNSEARAKKNIAAHYDLSNEFFALFLDPTMMYSAALFPTAETSLEDASRHKLDRACRELQLSPTDHLLEIGTGWGGLAIHAARNFGCRVTTTTLSQQQYEYTRAWVAREKLQDRIEVVMKDYRQLQGHFDKLVSIEMIEAVGHQYYGEYFRTCAKLLKPGGLMLLQAITIPDQRYKQALSAVDFIQRYIFPGGSLPCHCAIVSHVAEHTDMQLVGLQEMGLDYAQTLKHWRLRFQSALQQVRALGFDETFIRMWTYYLCYCEGGFRERAIGTAQYLLARPEWRPH